MDGLGVAAVIAAIGGLVAVLTTSYLQIQAANRTTGAVKELVPVVVDTAAKVEEVHVLTNNNYAEQKELNAALQAKLDALTAATKEDALLSLETTRRLLEESRAEVNRLNAAAPPPGTGAVLPATEIQPVRIVEQETPVPVQVVEPPTATR